MQKHIIFVHKKVANLHNSSDVLLKETTEINQNVLVENSGNKIIMNNSDEIKSLQEKNKNVKEISFSETVAENIEKSQGNDFVISGDLSENTSDHDQYFDTNKNSDNETKKNQSINTDLILAEVDLPVSLQAPNKEARPVSKDKLTPLETQNLVNWLSNNNISVTKTNSEKNKEIVTETSNQKKFSCKYCTKNFVNSYKMKIHETLCSHTENMGKSNKKDIILSEDQSVTNNRGRSNP